VIRPGLSDFLKISKKGSIVAIVKELPSDLITPVDAYYATSASYLLESVEKGSVIGRYSFLGIDPIMRFEVHGRTINITENGNVTKMALHDPIRKVGEILNKKPYIGEGDLSPFPGGAVGFIGYEYVQHWEKIGENSDKPGLNVPDSVFMVTYYNLVFDNLRHTLKIIANVHTGENLRKDYEKAIQGIQEIEGKLEDEHSNRSIPKISQLPEPDRITSSYTREKFMEAVQKAKTLITEGEAIQIVISQQMTAEFSGDPFLIFRALRTINPSPYMFYLNFGDFVILGASPEVMVKVDEKKALLRPIAGTRPRGKTSQEDEKLKNDLLSDEKELAEHIMLVDLARNDLGRIAKSGTVTPTRMMEVEMYSHVMHIVSEVTAEIADNMDVFDVIKATFPAGTVSGAPKVRAMEIINEFEPVKRGPYAGLIGYLSYNGTLDSCITIRSMVINNKKLYLQAGAGIVYDSVPEKEYEETLNKARALLKALSAGGVK
jgi:anthranilate synthase component 1